MVAPPPVVLPPGEVELPWARAVPQAAVTARPATRLRKKVDAGSTRPLINTVKGAGYIIHNDD